jgi:NADH-quinone oxidoreductase subunit A
VRVLYVDTGMASPLTPYLPVAVVLGLAGLLAVLIPALTTRLGPKSLTEIKSAAFECGSDPIGSARQRFAVKFYVVALLFIVFDVEAVFLYPWAVNFKALGWFGYGVMLFFASTLVAGLVYIWKKGALSWES